VAPSDREELVPGLGRGQHVAHGADAADARGDAGHLAEGASLAELLEAAELDDVEPGVGDLSLVVQEESDLRVALDAGDGVDDDALAHDVVPSSRT
jgi:hypothetical protein